MSIRDILYISNLFINLLSHPIMNFKEIKITFNNATMTLEVKETVCAIVHKKDTYVSMQNNSGTILTSPPLPQAKEHKADVYVGTQSNSDISLTPSLPKVKE